MKTLATSRFRRSLRLVFIIYLIIPHIRKKRNICDIIESNGGALESLMDYTLETLKKILRKRLQDEEFDGDTLTLFLNNSLSEILGEDKYPFMQRIDTYTADDKGEISCPPGYAGTFRIYARKPKQPRESLEYLSPEEFFERTKDHTMVWTVFANTIFYRIRKETDNEGYDILHLYLADPLPLVNDTDRPMFPPQFMEALILGALARAEEIRDNFDYSQLYRNQQDQILTNMKLRYGPGNLTAENRSRLPYNGGHGRYYYGIH